MGLRKQTRSLVSALTKRSGCCLRVARCADLCCARRMSHRLALDPPSADLTVLTDALLDAAAGYSRKSPRRRVIAPFHRDPAELLHRMLNAVQPDSYVRPHRHLDPPKAEAWVVLRGALLFFTFHDDGSVRERRLLRAAGPAFGVDLVPGVYHSFIALEPDTVIYEVKNGPYRAHDDKAFAPWAPAEGSAQAQTYMAELLAQHLACAQREAAPPA
jgi:cupin fold WbuC family metalloprotein